MEGPVKRIKLDETDTKVVQEMIKARYYNFKVDAFLDYMNAATEEEKQWVTSFAVKNYVYKTFQWVFQGPDVLLLVGHVSGNTVDGNLIYAFGRNGSSPKNIGKYRYNRPDFIERYPWIHRNDQCFSVLTREALTCIFSHLEDANDFRSVTLVSKLWYSAGTAPCLYEPRIKKLLEVAHMAKPPFEDPLFKPHQYFFALSFISVKTDEELFQKIFNHAVKTDNVGLIVYIRARYGGWGCAPLKKDYIVYKEGHVWYLKNKGSAEILFDGKYMYGNGSKLPCTSFTDHMFRPSMKFKIK